MITLADVRQIFLTYATAALVGALLVIPVAFLWRYPYETLTTVAAVIGTMWLLNTAGGALRRSTITAAQVAIIAALDLAATKRRMIKRLRRPRRIRAPKAPAGQQKQQT